GEELGEREHGDSRLALENALRGISLPPPRVGCRRYHPSRRRGKRAETAMPIQPTIIRPPPAGAAIGKRRASRQSRATRSPAKTATPMSRTTAAQRMTTLKKIRPMISSAGACTTRKVAAVAVLGEPPCAATAESATPAAPHSPAAR